MRTWAEINLDALISNYREIRSITDKKSKILAVVKADAYGHGFLEVARTLAAEGVDAFAVALIEEGLQLRRHGFTQPILVLGSIPEEDYALAVENNISLTVFSKETAQEISDIAQNCGKKAKIHIKLDTGMSRLGYVITDDNTAIIEEIAQIAAMPYIELEGIFSHFSTSDETDSSYTKMQLERFIKICDELKNRGITNIIRHIANSAAIMMYPEAHLDMVRPGIILYGLYPSHEVDKSKLRLVPVMSLKTKITHVKTLGAGHGISYGKDFVTEKSTKVATVPVGYADGYVRSMTKDGMMLVKEKKVRILGRICMDQCILDVTDIEDVNTGDEVIIFSDKGILADDVAAWSDTISYEVVCLVSKRVPRVYTKNGKIVNVLNLLDN